MADDEKQLKARRLLESASFILDPSRRHWFNHRQRKLFTERVVQDMPLDWLHERLKEAVLQGEYWFHSYYVVESGAWESVILSFELHDLRAVPKPVESRREP
jgi:hypothetical protein